MARSVFVGLVVVLSATLLCEGLSEAVPALQLYIPGAAYDETTETWLYDASNSFELQVLGASKSGNLRSIEDLFLFIAVPEAWLLSGGTVSVRGPGVDAQWLFPDGASWGTPDRPGKHQPLPSHGVYPAYYVSIPLPVMDLANGTDTINNYNPGESGQDSGVIYQYDVTYNGVFGVHLDTGGVAIDKNNKPKPVFAPFSHDADAPGGSPIPEPGTWLLLGLGLGLVGWRSLRRR